MNEENPNFRIDEYGLRWYLIAGEWRTDATPREWAEASFKHQMAMNAISSQSLRGLRYYGDIEADRAVDEAERIIGGLG